MDNQIHTLDILKDTEQILPSDCAIRGLTTCQGFIITWGVPNHVTYYEINSFNKAL